MRSHLALRPARTSAPRCAYCREAFGRERSCACRACGALLHDDCRRVLGACPSLGCEALILAPPRRGEAWRYWLFWPLFLGGLALFFLAGLAAAIGAVAALSGLLSGSVPLVLPRLLIAALGAGLMAWLGAFIRGLFEWV